MVLFDLPTLILLLIFYLTRFGFIVTTIISQRESHQFQKMELKNESSIESQQNKL